MIDRDRLVKTFCELASIDSPSGEEAEVAAELQRRLEALGLTVYIDDYGNVIANEGRESSLLISAHMDTVEPGRGIRPLVRGDRIATDGTTILGGDCKAGVAAILEAIQSVGEDGDAHIPVEVCFTREEEIGLVGARNLDFSKITARQAIVFDGEGPPSRITSTSPTYVGFDFEIRGRAAHAGVEPEKGLSAIRVAAEMITRLPQGRLDGETTFNVANIEGGTTRNTVPENATVRGEFRSASIEALDDIRASIDSVLQEVRAMFPEAVVEEHLHTEFEAYNVSADDPAVQRVQAAIRDLGMEPTMMPSGGGTDGNVFRQNDIAAVVVGMADSNMHTLQEYVTISEMVDAAHLCETLLKETR